MKSICFKYFHNILNSPSHIFLVAFPKVSQPATDIPDAIILLHQHVLDYVRNLTLSIRASTPLQFF